MQQVFDRRQERQTAKRPRSEQQARGFAIPNATKLNLPNYQVLHNLQKPSVRNRCAPSNQKCGSTTAN
eukprot:452104-Amphidinium_carterae.1